MFVYVDEPVLGALPAEAVPNAIALIGPIFDAIAAAGGVPGLHCCADVAPSHLARPGPTVVSFVDRSTPSPSHHDSAVLGDTSKWISFGLASTSGDRHDPFTNWLAYATDVPDPIDLARRSIVTATCGLGSTDQSSAEQAFRRAADVSQAIRRVADQSRGGRMR